MGFVKEAPKKKIIVSMVLVLVLVLVGVTNLHFRRVIFPGCQLSMNRSGVRSAVMKTMNVASLSSVLTDSFHL